MRTRAEKSAFVGEKNGKKEVFISHPCDTAFGTCSVDNMGKCDGRRYSL